MTNACLEYRLPFDLSCCGQHLTLLLLLGNKQSGLVIQPGVNDGGGIKCMHCLRKVEAKMWSAASRLHTMLHNRQALRLPSIHR
jgi:hypothetical protein